ncbi:MAG TPA: hypothetical protein VFM18_11845 [Methanosarcina sp.]|nr:hypothetical protein [Methanosarcina sp.]
MIKPLGRIKGANPMPEKTKPLPIPKAPKAKKIEVAPVPHSAASQAKSDAYTQNVQNNDTRIVAQMQSKVPGLTTSTASGG